MPNWPDPSRMSRFPATPSMSTSPEPSVEAQGSGVAGDDVPGPVADVEGHCCRHIDLEIERVPAPARKLGSNDDAAAGTFSLHPDVLQLVPAGSARPSSNADFAEIGLTPNLQLAAAGCDPDLLDTVRGPPSHCARPHDDSCRHGALEDHTRGQERRVRPSRRLGRGLGGVSALTSSSCSSWFSCGPGSRTRQAWKSCIGLDAARTGRPRRSRPERAKRTGCGAAPGLADSPRAFRPARRTASRRRHGSASGPGLLAFFV